MDRRRRGQRRVERRDAAEERAVNDLEGRPGVRRLVNAAGAADLLVDRRVLGHNALARVQSDGNEHRAPRICFASSETLSSNATATPVCVAGQSRALMTAEPTAWAFAAPEEVIETTTGAEDVQPTDDDVENVSAAQGRTKNRSTSTVQRTVPCCLRMSVQAGNLKGETGRRISFDWWVDGSDVSRSEWSTPQTKAPFPEIKSLVL